MLKQSKLVKEEHQYTNFGAKINEYQAIRSSLDEVKIEQGLDNLKSVSLHREKLKMEILRKEIVEANKGVVSRKIKVAALLMWGKSFGQGRRHP